ncbi:MAG TPA: hypothetical protein VJU82_17090 [Acidobacteriaceae bacterium]|nr:hypothetical protein [Acidobacteriaceae bacterium]
MIEGLALRSRSWMRAVTTFVDQLAVMMRADDSAAVTSVAAVDDQMTVAK